MTIRKYVLVLLVIVVLGVGAFIYLATNLAGGGSLNIQLPKEIVAGEETTFLVVANVWGGGGSIAGRYTDITFGYRLLGTDEFTVLSSTPAVLPENYKQAMQHPDSGSEYEAYSFTIPAFPVGVSGQLEYYVDSKLDGYQNHSTGTRPVVAKRVASTEESTVVLDQTYQNEEMGFEVMYPTDWGIETTGEYVSKKSNRVMFYDAQEATEPAVTFEILYGAIPEGRSIEAWYLERFPGLTIEDEMRTVIDHEPALLVDTGSSYVLYTKVRLSDVLLVSFPKKPLYQKMMASLRLNITNFGIVSFTQDDTATWETSWRITLSHTETRSSQYRIRSVLSLGDDVSVSQKNTDYPKTVPSEEFTSEILVTPDQIQKQFGDPVTFSFMLNYKNTPPNPEGPRSYTYIKPVFGFARHYAKDTATEQEVLPFATNGSVPMLGSGISAVEFNRTGKLIDGQLVLATLWTVEKYRYTILLEEINSLE